jgi:hypothetical protein
MRRVLERRLNPLADGRRLQPITQFLPDNARALSTVDFPDLAFAQDVEGVDSKGACIGNFWPSEQSLLSRIWHPAECMLIVMTQFGMVSLCKQLLGPRRRHTE